jgi:hypothetical protein
MAFRIALQLAADARETVAAIEVDLGEETLLIVP